MEGTWDVLENGKTVGQCTVKKEGLYYKIQCKCLEKPGLFRLYWGEESLGVLVPQEHTLVLETRQAIKRFASGKPRFSLRQPQEKRTEAFIPLCPGEPFAYIQDLERAHFARRDGRPGIVLFNKI